MKFSIRDLLLVTVIVALGVAWWADHRRQLASPYRDLPGEDYRLIPLDVDDDSIYLLNKRSRLIQKLPKE